ncbi:MAG TPA: YbjQ family protein [Verrucomicrobiae bacterium]|nr:YbjQ family protein [Verrucomicrobiae bacterium]
MDISFNCDKCGQHIVIDRAGAGQAVNCPKCGKSLTVPAAVAVPPRIPPIPANSAIPHQSPRPPVVVTTGNDLAGHEITQYLGIVRGIVVRIAGLKSGFSGVLTGLGKLSSGGNIPEWAAVCEAARQEAHSLMLTHASELGADAIIAVRYDATNFGEGSTEILAYGTAVRTKKV